MSQDNQFARHFGQDRMRRIEERADQALRERVALALVRALQVHKQLPALRRFSIQETGSETLDPRSVCQYLRLPIWLTARRIPGRPLHTDPQAVLLPRLLSRFDRTVYADAHRQFRESLGGMDEGRPLGVVLPCKGIGGGLVVHDGPEEWGRFGPCLRGQGLTVQRFADLLSVLHSWWRDYGGDYERHRDE